MAICGREKTNNVVFTAKTKTAAVLQPKNCHILIGIQMDHSRWDQYCMIMML